MDHFYRKIQGWFDYAALYNMMIEEMPDNFRFVELGVWKGKSLSYFVVESMNRGKAGEIFAVDHWLGSEEHQKGGKVYDPIIDLKDGLFEEFLRNISPVRDKIKVIRKPSLEAFKDFEDESLDSFFLDGSHDYDSAIKDMNAWFPKIKPGGIFAGHDFNWRGVREALKSFTDKSKLNFSVMHRSWYIKK